MLLLHIAPFLPIKSHQLLPQPFSKPSIPSSFLLQLPRDSATLSLAQIILTDYLLISLPSSLVCFLSCWKNDHSKMHTLVFPTLVKNPLRASTASRYVSHLITMAGKIPCSSLCLQLHFLPHSASILCTLLKVCCTD